MHINTSRRELLALTGSALCAAAAAPWLEETVSAQDKPQSDPFGYCFNTSTIRGQQLPLTEVVDVTAKAGWQGVEPWMDEINKHVEAGGSLRDLAKRIADHGLKVPSAIGFAEWIVNDDARRKKGLENMKRDMDLVAQIGGTRIAAPPVGAHQEGGVDLFKAAERYRAVAELGEKTGVTPQVEVWGFSKVLQRLGEAALVAIESGHPKACILADPYHMYKGGSSFQTLKMLGGASMHHMHVNDYPADPPRETIGDEHRVYPGDGVAPLGQMFRDLRDMGYRGMLSLELFSKELYKQDPLKVARTGLEKTRAAVRSALAA